MALASFGRKREIGAVAFLLAMVLCHVAMLLEMLPMLRGGYQDFTIFYTAGRLVRSGQTADLYDLSAQYRTQQEFAPDVHIRRGALPYNHPPFEALLFVPFTFVGYPLAYALWTFLNLAMLAIALAMLKKQFAELKRFSGLLFPLAAVGFFPIAIGLIQGQDAILLLLISVLGLVAAAKGKDMAAGAILALGLFKFHLILPLLLVVAVKRPRILIGFAPVTLLLAGTSVAMVGWHGAAGYVGFVLQLERGGAGAVVSDMPNLRGLIANLASARIPSPWIVVLTLAISLAVMLIALRRARTLGDSVPRLFALATITTILVSYHALPYDLSLLLPSALFLFAASDQPETDRHRLDLWLLALLFLTPLYVLLWLHWNQFSWYVLVLVALLWRVGRGSLEEQIAV
jgi:hypothetical protein